FSPRIFLWSRLPPGKRRTVGRARRPRARIPASAGSGTPLPHDLASPWGGPEPARCRPHGPRWLRLPAPPVRPRGRRSTAWAIAPNHPSFLFALYARGIIHVTRYPSRLSAYRPQARTEARTGSALARRSARRSPARRRPRAARTALATGPRRRRRGRALQRLQPVRPRARHRRAVRRDSGPLPPGVRRKPSERLFRDGPRPQARRPRPARAGNDQVVRHQLPLP